LLPSSTPGRIRTCDLRIRSQEATQRKPNDANDLPPTRKPAQINPADDLMFQRILALWPTLSPRQRAAVVQHVEAY
jgi:hypothetical protein